ncbi:MAG: glycerol-3-phosphate dehydrogenase/oxidase [Sporolactobacillus sp.]|jgi:glycerol-3-phosphate dehydrogenase|nr:glycerol-3-phosphate dehydrogenase/oxidase [Sporolactobacillus sp.]
MAFSSLERSRYLEKMAAHPLDLLIIGGGITGAGIALDASLRGLRTGLTEMQDFAGGTSSRSTKLIHGGLRYLKQFEIKLVADVGKERAIVYENAPHVTTPEKMMLPIYQKGTFGRFSTSLGLKLYDHLAGVKKSERRQMLSRAETLAKEPLLKKKGLLGGGYYVEYRTDDARLTIEVLKEAVAHGTLAVNYAKVEQLLYDGSQLIGAAVKDRVTGKLYRMTAKKVVNAAGPWVDTIRDMDHSKTGKHLHLTKGVHLVFDRRRFPMRQSVYFDTTNGDKRMLFVIPRGNKVYAGTTDTTYNHYPIDPKPLPADRDYILDAVNGMFPSVGLRAEDVESSWAGVRPLIQEEGKSPSEISRKDEIFLSPSGLISIAGGKLTGYRKMAQQVVDEVTRQLEKENGQSYPPCATIHAELSGGHFGGADHFPGYIRRMTAEGKQVGLTDEEAEKLVRRYGSNVPTLLDRMGRHHHQAKKYGLPNLLYAMLDYAITEEMIWHPIDFFTRRTGATFFDIQWAQKWAHPVLNCLADRLSWNAGQVNRYTARLEDAFLEAEIKAKPEKSEPTAKTTN